MTRQEKVDKITRLCNHAGCSAKLKKIHFEQFVDRQWHPHPPKTWEVWIRRHPDFKDMIYQGTSEREASVKLFNCARYYDQFCEARQMGVL